MSFAFSSFKVGKRFPKMYSTLIIHREIISAFHPAGNWPNEEYCRGPPTVNSIDTDRSHCIRSNSIRFFKIFINMYVFGRLGIVQNQRDRTWTMFCGRSGFQHNEKTQYRFKKTSKKITQHFVLLFLWRCRAFIRNFVCSIFGCQGSYKANKVAKNPKFWNEKKIDGQSRNFHRRDLWKY